MISMGLLLYWPEGGPFSISDVLALKRTMYPSLRAAGTQAKVLKKGCFGAVRSESLSNVLSCLPNILAAPWGSSRTLLCLAPTGPTTEAVSPPGPG